MKLNKKIVAISCVALVMLVSAYHMNEKKLKLDEMPKMDFKYTKALIYDPVIRIESDESTCSAFVISKNYALTAAHCVEGIKQKFKVYATKRVDSNKKIEKTDLLIKVASYAPRLDIAALTGDFSEFGRLELIKDEQDITGPFFLAIGANAREITIKTGNEISYFYFGLKSNMKLLPGMSGGPLIEVPSGKVVGINSAMDIDGAIFATVENINEYLSLKND